MRTIPPFFVSALRKCAQGALLAIAASSAIALVTGGVPLRAAVPTSQTAPPSRLEFDVASITQSPRGATADLGGCCGVVYQQGRIRGINVGLVDLIMSAYRIQLWQLSGWPAWAYPNQLSREDRYMVEARAASEAPPDQLREMLKTLLVERFHLVMQRDTTPGPAWDLVVDSGGPHLPVSTAQAEEPRQMKSGGGQLIVNRITMREMAAYLEGQEPKAPVADHTGLTGTYAITLHWTPERFRLTGVGVAPSAGEPGIDPNGPSIMTAIREQLGLRLDKTTRAIEHFTIQRAERPSPN